MIERCGDRQRKCDGLERWPFHMFVRSLPVMLQTALLLLACGLCRYMASVNATVAYILITLTGLGVLFYVGIVVAGASSYDCPFQTPASVPLSSLWNKVGPHLTSATLLTITFLRALGEVVQRHISRIMIHLPQFDIPQHLHSLSERIQLGILRVSFCLSPTGLNIRSRFRHPLLPTVLEDPPSPISQDVIPWFAPGELSKIQVENTNDVRCVSWVIRNITDPETLDAAIRRAGMIRWFDDGIDMEPPYDLIVSTFHACFGSDGEVYPGSRDRAYYSRRAILWIHTLAMCKSRTFLLPTTRYRAPASDHDLTHLLNVTMANPGNLYSVHDLFNTRTGVTPSHSQWISSLLLHLSWAPQVTPDFDVYSWMRFTEDPGIPLGGRLNYFLMCCNLLGSPVREEVLKIEDKSCGISCLCLPSYSHRCLLATAWSRP